MKNLLFALTLTAALFLGAASPGTLRFKGDKGDFVLERMNVETAGQLLLCEKDKKAPLPLKFTVKGSSVTAAADGIRWNISLKQKHNLWELEGEIVNTSGRQRLLEPVISWRVPREKGSRFWGGFDLQEAKEKSLQRKGFKGRTSKHLSGGLSQPFPTASLLNKDLVFILGQRQWECTSYNAAVYTPESTKARLTFSQRIVLEKGEKLPVRFACGIVKRRFGADENVVQAFYDAFPENWRPFVSKRNPYLKGTHSKYSAWAHKPKLEFERRKYSTLDWAYTPYKRSGDCFGRPEYWDYKPLVRPFAIRFGQLAAGINFDYRKLTCDEFHKRRQDIFKRFGRKFGYSFYVCAGWCELALANEHYKDSLTEDKSVPLILGPWSTSHDRERRVFPYGNSYGKAFMKDLAYVVKELDLPGFAIDCGTPGVNHYGAAAKNPAVKGRSWDEKGIFIDELCAINQVIDYIHRLRPADPLYAWKNGGGNADMLMIETDLFSRTFQSWMPLTRYNIGQRPAVLHVREGWNYYATIPQWRTLTLKEMLVHLKRLGDHMTFSDFEYGMTNTHYGYGGNYLSQYCMPELLECIELGWHALVPVEPNGLGEDRMLYKARYGSGADTILFFGNPYEKPIPIDFAVDNDGLKSRHLVFLPKMRDNAALENTLDKTDTSFTFALPSRLPVLFEAAAAFSALPAGGKLKISAKAVKDIHKMTYTLKLNNAKPFRSALTPRNNPGFTSEIRLNGKKVSPQTLLTIPARAEIAIHYRSTVFRDPAATFVKFPYLSTKNAPIMRIILPDDPNEAEKFAAERIMEYFKFTGEKKITAPSSVGFSKKSALKNYDRYFEISCGRGKSGVYRQGKGIQLHGADALTLRENTGALLQVMDRRFPWFMNFVMHSKMSGEVIRKFGLSNVGLPWKPCFETEKMKVAK
jgi:hypothetical protein